MRFYAHRHRPDGAELNSDNGATEGGQVLAEVVVCAVGLSYYTPCGDDCAIYCLAGAGDRRRWNETQLCALKNNGTNGEDNI